MRFIVDTSVLFRLFEKGESRKKREAKTILEKEELFIPSEVIVELSYLLKTRVKLSKKEIIHEIRKIISYPNIETEEEVLIALEIFDNYPVDKIVDALEIAKALKRGYGLITNDETQAKVFEILKSF